MHLLIAYQDNKTCNGVAILGNTNIINDSVELLHAFKTGNRVGRQFYLKFVQRVVFKSYERQSF